MMYRLGLVVGVLVWLCVGAVPGAEPMDVSSPALRGQLEKLDAAIADAPDDPMNHYRKAQCLTKMGEYDRGYQAAREAMQRFTEKKSTLPCMLLEEIDLGTVHVRVIFNMGPDERQPPVDHGIVRPVSFIVRKEGLQDVIDYEIGYLDGEPSTAALGMTQPFGSHANLGMIRLDAKYEAIRKQALGLIKTRYKPEPVERPASRAEVSGKQKDEKLFPIRLPGEQPRWGYMNREGEVVIQADFWMAHDFSEGMARVTTLGGTAYIDKQGRKVCSPPAGACSSGPFSDGLAMFAVHVEIPEPGPDDLDFLIKKWGYFDAAGEVVVEPKFDDARDFSEGLARVNVGAEPHPLGQGIVGGRWGFTDQSGNWVVKPGDLVAVEDFSEGLGLVYLQKDHTWAFVRKKGEIALKLPRYWPDDEGAGSKGPAPGTTSRLHIRTASSFSEGLARVCYGNRSRLLFGFVDHAGKQVFSMRPHRVQDFSEGLAVCSDGEKFGYLNRKGEWVISPRFDSARRFSEGLAAVRIGKTWKYIDKQGNDAFVPGRPENAPGPFNIPGNFSGGLARVHFGGAEFEADVPFTWWEGGAWYYLNRRGEIVKRMGKDSEVPSEMHVRAMMDADRYPNRQAEDVKRMRKDGQGGPRSAY